jgi:hypothetical protein
MCTMYFDCICSTNDYFCLPSFLPFHLLNSFPSTFLYFKKSRLHIGERSCDVCLSECGLFGLIWWSPVYPLSCKWQFCSSFWLNNTPLCIYTLKIYLSANWSLDWFLNLGFVNTVTVNWCANISIICWLRFLWVYTQERYSRIICQLYY